MSNPLSIIAKVLLLLGGILTLATGIASLTENDDGRALKFSGDDFINERYSASFRVLWNIHPDTIGYYWSPTIFGILMIFTHFYDLQWNFLFGSWIRVALIIPVIAIFCNIGYAGGLGIITGIFNLVAWILYVVLAIQAGDESPSLGISIGKDGVKVSNSATVTTTTTTTTTTKTNH